MTNLTQKFAALSSQLATQHAQILELLGWIRQDVADMKTSLALMQVSTGNTATFAEQMNLHLAAIEAWSTATRFDTMQDEIATTALQTAAMRGVLLSIRTALMGTRTEWTETAIADAVLALATLSDAELSGFSTWRDNMLGIVDSISACVCTTPDPCAAGTPLDVTNGGDPRDLIWTKPEGTEVIATAIPLYVAAWIDPVNSGGSATSNLAWALSSPAIVPVMGAEFCIMNGTAATTIHYAILDVTDEPPAQTSIATVAPGITEHIYNIGALTWLALWVDAVPDDMAAAKVIVFAAG